MPAKDYYCIHRTNETRSALAKALKAATAAHPVPRRFQWYGYQTADAAAQGMALLHPDVQRYYVVGVHSYLSL
jgi:hypothetical protein